MKDYGKEDTFNMYISRAILLRTFYPSVIVKNDGYQNQAKILQIYGYCKGGNEVDKLL